MILADVLESARTCTHVAADRRTTRHVLVILVEYPRDPRPGEPGCDWIAGTQAQRAAVLAAQTAVLLSTYLRMLGHRGARAQRHLQRGRSAAAWLWPAAWPMRRRRQSLPRPAVIGLARSDHDLRAGRRPAAGTARPTATLALARPGLVAGQQRPGQGTSKTRSTARPTRGASSATAPSRSRRCKRRDKPTTFIDHDARAAISQARRLLRPRLVRRPGQDGAGQRQERALRDEEPDRRLCAACARRLAAAAVWRGARPGVAEHRRPAAQRRTT